MFRNGKQADLIYAYDDDGGRVVMLPGFYLSGPSASTVTRGIAVSSSSSLSADKYRSFQSQHKRNGNFTNTLSKHGMPRDTSLFAATRAKKKKTSYLKHRFESMDNLIKEYDREVSVIVDSQKELLEIERRMAIIALEMVSVRILQQAVRSWQARHKLKRLKAARFIYDRIYFRRYYRIRIRAALRMGMRMLMFMARRLLKIHIRENKAARLIQKLYHKWRMYKILHFRITVLGKVATLWKHYALFGKCRAIMHMRRKEVLRVQKMEKAQYKILLAQEQQRAAEAEIKAAEEAKRLALEARHRSKSRFAAAAKKQRASGPIVAAATTLSPSSQHSAGAGSFREGSSSEGPPHIYDTGDSKSAHAASASTESNSADNKNTVDPALILKAFSTGLIAGHNTTQAMHSFVENRYGSVYGGFYGEYCCIQDNRVHSFAAVRFRFMLRCLRNKRKKALNGPQAKSFFYILSHLHNTPQVRNYNPIVQYLQTTVRAHAVQQTLRHTHAPPAGSETGVGKAGMGRMLLSSFRRTKLSLAVPQETPAMVTTTSEGASTSTDTRTEESTLSALPSSSPPKKAPEGAGLKGPHSPERTSPIPFGPGSPVTPQGSAKASTNSEVKFKTAPTSEKNALTIPIYTTESFPPCFVTESYRPRTFAELVLLILDLKKAVMKNPSLVDDATPPPLRVARPTKIGVQGIANALAKGHGTHKRKDSAHHGSPIAHRDSQHGSSNHAAVATTHVKTTTHKPPPPLVRMDSNRSTGSTGTGKDSRPTLVRERSGKSPFPETSEVSDTKPPLTSTKSFKGAPLEMTLENVTMTPTQPKEPKPPLVSKRSVKSAQVTAIEPVVMIPIAQTTFKAPPHKYTIGDDREVNTSNSVNVAINEVPDLIELPSNSTTSASAGVVDSDIVNRTSVTQDGTSIPAQLRANSRILRPSFTMNTPYLAPTPYPSSPPGRYTASLLEEELLSPETLSAVATRASKTHSASAAARKENAHDSTSDKYIEQAVKEAVMRFEVPSSIPPSEILAAARLSVRQASASDGAEATPPLNRSAVASRESIRTPMSTSFGGLGSFKANSFVTRNLPAIGGAAEVPPTV